MTWTQEREDTARALWLEGKSASQIAVILGDVSRNGVIGKVHRLGLSRFQKHTITLRRKYRKPDTRTISQRNRDRDLVARIARGPKLEGKPLPQSDAWEPIPGTTPIGILELTDKTCRWPLGEKPFRYCGCPTAASSSYCETHLAISTGVFPVNNTDPIPTSDTSPFHGAGQGKQVLADRADLHELST